MALIAEERAAVWVDEKNHLRFEGAPYYDPELAIVARDPSVWLAQLRAKRWFTGEHETALLEILAPRGGDGRR